MSRRTALLSSVLAVAFVTAVVLVSDGFAGQVVTPEPGTTGSTQSGYVKNPLPGGTPADANTLELTRLQIGGGDEIAFEHLGAAIYYVDAGSVVATFSSSGTVRFFDSGEDGLGEPTTSVECTSGCTLESGDWFSFDAGIQLTLAADDDALVTISSLTPDGGEVILVTTMSEATPIVIVGDSSVVGP